MDIQLIQSNNLKFLSSVCEKLQAKIDNQPFLMIKFDIVAISEKDWMLKVSNTYDDPVMNFPLFYWLGYYVRMCKEL